MELELVVESCISGHHDFKTNWCPIIGEWLSCKQQIEDQYVVADRTTVVGHVLYTGVGFFDLSLAYSEGTRIGMPAFAKNRYSAMSSTLSMR